MRGIDIAWQARLPYVLFWADEIECPINFKNNIKFFLI